MIKTITVSKKFNSKIYKSLLKIIEGNYPNNRTFSRNFKPFYCNINSIRLGSSSTPNSVKFFQNSAVIRRLFSSSNAYDPDSGIDYEEIDERQKEHQIEKDRQNDDVYKRELNQADE